MLDCDERKGRRHKRYISFTEERAGLGCCLNEEQTTRESPVKTRIAMIALAVVTIVSFAAPAFADPDDWYRGRAWREHEWREHEWREHHWRPYAAYGPRAYYYDRYDARPPVVYAPPAPSLNIVIPLGRR